MKKKWLVASYKSNQVKRLERNLLNQKFDYYLPKITTKKINCKPKEKILFPGYIFVNTNFENYSAVKYTIGITNIIKFGDNITSLPDNEIATIKKIEESSKLNPIIERLKIGKEVLLKEGAFKGNIVKICSLPSKERVDVLLSFLGSLRKVTIPEKILKI